MPRSFAAVEALAAAVAEWLPGVGLTCPPVVGNSLGGAVVLELTRIGAVGSAVALSPIGLWTRAEAAYALGSLRVARAMARACAEPPGWIAGHPIGRTVAFWQLVARPWRIPQETAAGALRNLARSPGFEPTRRAALAYRLRAFTPAVPVTVGWGHTGPDDPAPSGPQGSPTVSGCQARLARGLRALAGGARRHRRLGPRERWDGPALLDCWPILVDLERGDVRFGTLDERHRWRTPSA
ncbi:hypothetical protein ACGFNV_36330 [Streptomyces sp. NPDC048751]|uniref:hypothetical protein n=1 Tax=Streptomyces sp. NPDC048751 TaxID=3365591 RepID=UPI0037193359